MRAIEFNLVFQLSKLEIFEVNYYTLDRGCDPYFYTRAAVFVRNKKDYSICGQCQDEVLNNYKTAFDFYKKWDEYHLLYLNDNQYKELLIDIEYLKQKYNYINSSNFEDIMEFSKQKVKTINK